MRVGSAISLLTKTFETNATAADCRKKPAVDMLSNELFASPFLRRLYPGSTFNG